jgi:hypothetical protein
MTKLADFLKDLPKNRLIHTDNWNILHVDQLADIGFKQNGQWRMDVEKPRLTIIYVKDVGFVLIDLKKKDAKTFKNFNDLSVYLMDYKQDWENAPYTDTGGK